MKKQRSCSTIQIPGLGTRRWWLSYGCLVLLYGCAETASNVPSQPLPAAVQRPYPPAAPFPPTDGRGGEQAVVATGPAVPPSPPPSQPPPLADSGNGQDLPILDAGGQPQVYVVQKRDSLLKIAGCFKTTVDTIMDLNPTIKDPNLIFLNQKLLLPGNLVNNCKMPVDACLNLPGHQPSVPAGMLIDSHGNCVPDPAKVDVCPNLVGQQQEVPNNMIKDSAGSCVFPLPAPRPAALPVLAQPPVIDFCPNLAGLQRAVPAGMIKDPNGNCVEVYVPCETVFRGEFSGGTRKVLMSAGGASGLLGKYLRAAEAKRVEVSLETLVVMMYLRTGEKMELVSIQAPKLSVWQNATGKHEREWLRLLQDKRAERLPSPVEVAERLRADVVCGEQGPG